MEDVDGKEDVEVACVEGVLDGALGALGDEHGFCGEGVVLSSWVRSMNNCLGGIMTSFCLLPLVEFEVFGDDMVLGLSLMVVNGGWECLRMMEWK